MHGNHDGMDFILTTLTNGIQQVILNRPKRKNAITVSMYNELADIFNESSKNNNVHTLILSGKGDFFSSGNDLIDMISKNPEFTLETITEATMSFKKFVDAIIVYPKLLIAVVNGPAIGIGATMLGLFDIVYASDKAYFHTPFSNLGLTAEGCSTYTFPKIMGTSKAGEMLYLGYKMNATEAKHYGFVSQVYKHDCLDDVWVQIGQISKLSSTSILVTKRLVRKWEEKKLLDVNTEEVKELIQRWENPDFMERVASFLTRKSKL